MTMRVYVPATWPMLRTLVKSGELDPIGGTAFALTPRLREHYTSGDDEELEYAAMNEAARASLRLLSVELCLDEPALHHAGGQQRRRLSIQERMQGEAGRCRASRPHLLP